MIKKTNFIATYNFFCIPALVVHEFLHFLFIKITFANYTGTTIAFDDDYNKTLGLSVRVYYVPSNSFQTFIVSLAPILGLFVWTIPYFLGLQTLTFISVLYTLICIKVVLPSSGDIDAIRDKQKFNH